MTNPAFPPLGKPGISPLRSKDGIALLAVIMIIAGLVVLALPLALMSHDYEMTSERISEDAEALHYAEMALNHVKQRLRRGVWEREMEAAGLVPTASPTPTPSVVPDLEPYDTPEVDGPAELYVGRRAFWEESFGEGIQRPDGVVVGVEVEDEQGKINLNSVSPELLEALYLVVTGTDPADFDDAARDDFHDLCDNLLEKLALLRVRGDGSPPRLVSNVAELERGFPDSSGRTWKLSADEYELLARHLTVYSWRLNERGFSPTGTGVTVRALTDTDRANGYLVIPSLPPLGTVPVRLEFLDSQGRTISGTVRYVLPERVQKAEGGTEIRLPLDDVPDEAEKAAWVFEEAHSVNVNTCSREVLAALIEAGADFDDPAWTFDELWEVVRKLKPEAEIVRAEETDEGVALYPADAAVLEDFGSRRFYCSFGDRYFFARVDGDHIIADELAEGEADLLLAVELPATAYRMRNVYLADHFDNSIVSPPNPALLARLKELFGTPASPTTPVAVVTTFSHDVYTIRAWASVNADTMLERARAGVCEVVSLGLNLPALEEGPYFEVYPPFRFASRTQFLPSAYWAKSSLNWTDPDDDTPDPDDGRLCYAPAAPRCLPPGDPYVLWRGTDGPESSFGSSDVSGFSAPDLLSQNTTNPISSPVEFEDSSLNAMYYGKGEDGPFALNGSIGVSMWVKAMGWEPWKDESACLFWFSPGEIAQVRTGNDSNWVTGSWISLYIEKGKLVLEITDDAGHTGYLKYGLDASRFPKGVWMHVGFQASGNRRGQMALFVDNRLVNAEWSGSADEGWCHRVDGDWPCSVPVLTLPFEKGASSMSVSSTAGFPDSGYLRVGGEVVYYSSKTASAFNGVRRGVGGTAEEDHLVGAKVLPAAALHNSPLPEEIPRAGDEVFLFSYQKIVSGSSTYRVRRAHFERFTLDMDAVFDTERNVWVMAAPAGVSFADSEALPGSGDDRIFVLHGVSGTLPTGKADRGNVPMCFLSVGTEIEDSLPNMEDEKPDFSGLADHLLFFRNYTDALRLPSELKEDTSSVPRTYFSYPLNDGDTGLCKVDDEMIGFRVDGSEVVLTRGMLGSKPAAHSAGTWVTYVDMFPTIALKTDLSANDTIYYGDPPPFPWARVDDEIICFVPAGRTPEDEPVTRLLRGGFGSTKAAHSAGTLAVVFPVPAMLQYDFENDDFPAESYIEFQAHRARQRCLWTTWEVYGADEDFVTTHCWVKTHGYGGFTSSAAGAQTFHFEGDGTGGTGSVSRNGLPVLSDEAFVRLAFGFKPGAWLPDDPTRHAWKARPQVRVWLGFEEADKILEHMEER